MNKQAQDLQPGDMLDLEPYWTARFEFFEVESVQISPNGVQCRIFLVNAPSNVICDRDQLFELGTSDVAELAGW